MNKLAIIVPFYKREALTKLCFKRLLSQSKRLGVDVIVAGSEEEDSKKLAKGFKYIEVKNVLGFKLNALLNECKSYDGVILLGSDDFISDSVIKMYQEIDTTKEVFYSFNDVYVYSARFKKVVSDLDFTRAGHGIGVARMFTKPTLKKMNYKLWEDNRMRGLDTDSVGSLNKAGISQILLDFKGHFVIDIKLEYNLTNQGIVETGHKEHSLNIIKKNLGQMGDQILALKTKDIEHVKRININTKPMEKVKALIVKSFHQYEEGETIEIRTALYKRLKKGGFVKEAPVKKVKKAPAKKQVKKSK
jgi:glycosyltransferase involved in cell wall biosynthesis